MSDKQTVILEEALTRYIDESLQGKLPDINEFARQYPQCEAQLKVRIQDLKEIDFLFDTIVQADDSDFENTDTGQDLVGQKVGNFEIAKIIGRGGMGVVYLARDTKLDRSVAIKSIPAKLADDSTARMRFRREAKLLASMNHPNIAVIHDIIEQDNGAGYLVLEYVPGETLAERINREPLELEEALSIARQIAEAVSAAHKKGIIHRDLKPGNIKLTPEGRVKVLDFGLAKSSVIQGKDIEITSTEPGHIIGTPAYMSPEQARGNPTDHRTDIWSFGCTMYQMLTGSIPFEGQTATDTLAHIIERQPDWELLPNETPENIRILLNRCLEKDPNRRLVDIADAAIDIRETLNKPATAPPAKLRRMAMVIGTVAIAIILCAIALKVIPQKEIQSPVKQIRLVILPFENLGSTEDEYFADGITDAITARLAGIHGLGVISRQSAIQYKKSEKDTRQIAEELRVDYILEGTIQRERPSDPNSRVRIIPQLINASEDTHMWTEIFDDDMSEVFRLQSDVAEKVARALDITLLEPERRALVSRPTENLEAYEYYLQGQRYRARSWFEKDFRESSFKIATRMYERAVELDPVFAIAYAKLCIIHCDTYKFGYDRSQERLAMAKQAVEKALEHNPDLPEAHLALGHYYANHLDKDRALEQFAIARKSQPNNGETIAIIGYIQRTQGKFEQALTNFNTVLELNPLNPNILMSAGHTSNYLHKYSEADHYFNRAISLAPHQPMIYGSKAWLYLIWEGNTEKARAVLAEAQQNIESTEKPFVKLLVTLDVFDRDYSKALDRLSTKSEDIDSLGYIDDRGYYIPNSLLYARIYGYMNKKELEQANYESARSILESKIDERPEHARLHAWLGIAYAGLGSKEDAIRKGKLAIELRPVSKHAMEGPIRVEDLARIYVMVGEHNKAIEKLEYLLSIPGPLSIHLLRLDPAWDPIRNHQRFIDLLESGNQKK